MRVHSDEKPVIRRLQGVILYPHDICEEPATEDKCAGFSCQILRVEDRQQPIDDAAEFALRNYKDLRRALYPPIADQLDAQYHDMEAWVEVISAIKAAFPKP